MTSTRVDKKAQLLLTTMPEKNIKLQTFPCEIRSTNKSGKKAIYKPYCFNPANICFTHRPQKLKIIVDDNRQQSHPAKLHPSKSHLPLWATQVSNLVKIKNVKSPAVYMDFYSFPSSVVVTDDHSGRPITYIPFCFDESGT